MPRGDKLSMCYSAAVKLMLVTITTPEKLLNMKDKWLLAGGPSTRNAGLDILVVCVGMLVIYSHRNSSFLKCFLVRELSAVRGPD